jgi:hypothetical protein
MQKIIKARLLLNQKLTEAEHMILNRMGCYDLEVITIKVLSSLFGEYGEASMGKTATFMVHLVRNIHFHIEVVTGHREGSEPEEKILSETPSEPVLWPSRLRICIYSLKLIKENQ